MRLVVLLIAAGSAAGCASSGAVDAALNSDLATLRERLAAERRAGDIDSARAREIAEAVAAREVYSGKGSAGARHIRSLRRCAKPLARVLEARAEVPDEPGAEAMLALLALGRVNEAALVARYARSDSGAWRAVAARAATQPEYFELRRRFYVDPDERARRAAFEAAYEHPADLDLESLIEAARLDPDPHAQGLAIRGIGALGGERAVRALGDLWERSNERLRLSIVEAWSARRTFSTGGRAALLREAESGRGITAAASSATLYRVDPSSRALAVTLLARAALEGTSDEQLLAVAFLPLSDPRSVDLLKQLAGGADPSVAVAANERLLEVATERAAARAALRQNSLGESPAALSARAALARSHDPAPVARLRLELVAPEATRREAAGRALLALGDVASAAQLLADASADVRVATACSLLQLD